MIVREKIIQEKYFTVGENRYFLVEVEQKRHAIPDKCPHRGGPLSLGKICKLLNIIQCPWHEGQFKISSLIRNGVNAIRVRDEIFYV